MKKLLARVILTVISFSLGVMCVTISNPKINENRSLEVCKFLQVEINSFELRKSPDRGHIFKYTITNKSDRVILNYMLMILGADGCPKYKPFNETIKPGVSLTKEIEWNADRVNLFPSYINFERSKSWVRLGWPQCMELYSYDKL
jgi:hypothetical protein